MTNTERESKIAELINELYRNSEQDEFILRMIGAITAHIDKDPAAHVAIFKEAQKVFLHRMDVAGER